MPFTNPSPVQKRYSGRFTGINGVNPTTKTLDSGVTVTRTAEGVYRLNLPAPLAGFKSVLLSCNDATGYHVLSHALSVPARTVTITHRTCAFTDIATGPVAEDVVSEINFVIIVEESDTIGAGI